MYHFKTRKQFYLILSIFIFLLLFLIVFSSSIGAASIGIENSLRTIFSRIPIIGNLFDNGVTDIQRKIIFNIRLPRILLSIIVGIGLSISGVTYQGIFKNPMADPYILGISSGAALGASLSMIFNIYVNIIGFSATSVMAFVFALITTFIVYFIAKTKNKVPVITLILSGVAVSYLFSSAISLLMFFNREQVESIIFWTMGSFNNASYSKVIIAYPIILLGSFFVIYNSRKLNLLSLGDETATSLGVNVERLKTSLLVVTSLIIALCVSVSGIIGFVGLIVPHAARLVFGAEHKKLVPFSALIGAIFLLASDTLARTLVMPSEIPVGAITSFFGAPFFIMLLIKNKRKM